MYLHVECKNLFYFIFLYTKCCANICVNRQIFCTILYRSTHYICIKLTSYVPSAYDNRERRYSVISMFLCYFLFAILNYFHYRQLIKVDDTFMKIEFYVMCAKKQLETTCVSSFVLNGISKLCKWM